MAKPTFADVQNAVPDPLLSDNFLLNIPNIPTNDSPLPLMFQCRTVAKPGKTINAVEVQLFGHTQEHAGNTTFSHDMSVEYVENRRAQIHTIIEAWMELCRSDETQTGEYKNEYARDAFLQLFDQKGIVVKEYKIEGLWPNTMPETSLNGAASDLIALQVGFKYDRYLTIR